jgi:predicted amidohydrolase YtcJ
MQASTRARWRLGLGIAAAVAALTGCPFDDGDGVEIADAVYRNGHVLTMDAADSEHQAIAIRDGRVLWVGSDAEVAQHIGATTEVVDLAGRTLMPGIVDGHNHVVLGGENQELCNLGAQVFTAESDAMSIIQGCLNDPKYASSNNWLEVRGWLHLPGISADLTKSGLDGLTTTRPIKVVSVDFHKNLVNTKALELAGITRDTPQPPGGRIGLDAAGNPNGVLEDLSAIELVDSKVTPLTAAEQERFAKVGLKAMGEQGITSFLNPLSTDAYMSTFRSLQAKGELTARASFAIELRPGEGAAPDAAIAAIKARAAQFDQGEMQASPGVTVQTVKLFLDGVIQWPAQTAAVFHAYREPDAGGNWIDKLINKFGNLYFEDSTLTSVLKKLTAAGLDVHMHADGARAVSTALNAVEATRSAYPGKDLRFALAHAESIDPADLPRFKALNAIPVLSLQWGKRAPDTVDAVQGWFNDEAYRYVESYGRIHQAGARVAYGSDWPVDALNTWFNLKVGVTRTNSPEMAAAGYAGRLGDDPGMPVKAVLRAATINAAYQLRQESKVGSLEAGKFADLIVIDSNPVTLADPEQIANVKVLRTVVGGKVVYQAPGF